MGWYDMLASLLYHGIREDQGLQYRPIFDPECSFLMAQYCVHSGLR